MKIMPNILAITVLDRIVNKILGYCQDVIHLDLNINKLNGIAFTFN